ncbi:MAG: HAD family hydrolase, partial [Candidatus Jordarchaeaceae archaeon]
CQHNSQSKIERFLKEVDEAVEKYEVDAAHKTSPIPGAVELVRKLKDKGFKLGIFTFNKSYVVNFLLSRIGIRDLFDAVVGRDNVERPKPDSSHLNKTLSLLGVKAEETIVVGDHPNDIVSARRVGAKSIGVLSSGHTVEELKSAGADLVLRDVSLILPTLFE